jgi:hypothetical protein
MNVFIVRSRICLFSIILLIGSCQQESKSPPNIIIIFTDDQGYGDVGSYGATQFTTPHLDQMAAEGMRFTNFYAAQAVCSASRAALLTGCYPNRIGITGAMFPTSKIGLHKDEITIAEMLKSKGYATGIFGKWHLGHEKPFLPLQHGFDEYFGLPYSNDMWPVDFAGNPVHEKSERPWKTKFPVLPLIDGNDLVEEVRTLEDQAQLVTRYTERAITFIAGLISFAVRLITRFELSSLVTANIPLALSTPAARRTSLSVASLSSINA